MPESPFPPIRHIHVIGICGTAMGSVAAMLRDDGYTVTGSDERVYPPMSTFLQEKGIVLREGYSPANLEPLPNLVIVGNAISRGNPELEHVLDQRMLYLSLPETLKLFYLRHTHNLVVTGTHGKTTTTSLLAWIFQHTGRQPSYMIGGIPLNFGQGCRRQDGKYWILEGDEYDTAFFDKRSKFLHYLPELAIINNVEFDHADIYDDLHAVKKTFRHLVNIVPGNGMIVLNADDANALEVTRHARAQLVEVGFSENAAVRITDHTQDAEGSHFTLLGQRFTVPLYGRHNVHNTAMAVTAAHNYQIPLPDIAAALRAFQGVKRRMEVRGEPRGATVIDDFAHHPTAIRETLQALRVRYPGRRLWALFEPRSNTTRRAVFQNDLPAALALADRVVLTQVARAGQLKPGEGLDVPKVVADTRDLGVEAWYVPEIDDLVALMQKEATAGDVVAVLSNGSFGGLIPRLLQQHA
ncbi:MAG: UDP-N-acetylmuramate:L-alanyl-gamma-D-glutamyl-meso-diaminopimelate ligase [Candidatus Methylacidiphilales bacterium]|nr:UDP-N-acetylmuramate:L-alanyl-gamma-D-glutamyl-meso-diaminopimelate ligase [Candidatus Methylacidiphilales bacterium]